MFSNRRFRRREFLQSTAAAAALTPWGGGAATLLAEDKSKSKQGPPKAEKRFKKAVKIGMVRVKGTLTDKFKLLKELGFDGVELNSPGGPSADEVKRAIDEAELPVHGVVDSVHWRSTLSAPDPAVRAKGLAALKQALQDVKAYGGTSVLLVPAVCNKMVSYEQAWERSVPEIKKALPLAEKLEIDILLENVWNNFLTDPKETARYIDQFKSARLGAYYDVGNSVRYAPTVEWVKTLGKRIRKLDIKEYDLKRGREQGWYDGFKVKLLEGTCNWPGVMEALREIGFSGWGTAEIPGGGRERLQEIATRMDRIYAGEGPRG